MKPSIWTDYFGMISPEEGILAFTEAGFFYGELGIDHSRMLRSRSTDMEKTGQTFRSFLADQGFSLPEGHLDFAYELTDPDAVDVFKREITLFQAIGIHRAVIHINGGMDLPVNKREEIQMTHMGQLLEFVRDTDFTLCLENLRPNPSVADADKILRWIDALGGKNLGICLDTGHLNVARIGLKTTEQTQSEFIRKAGSYLKATHINGNDGTDDYHLAPYCIKNSVNWPEVVTSLRELGYDGLFTLEIPGEIKGNPPLHILKHKLRYLKELVCYMLSDTFLQEVCAV